MSGSRGHLSLRLCLLGALLATTPAWPQQAASPPVSGSNPLDFVQLGIEQAKKGNLDGAMSAFNQALAIDPHCVPALEKKGLVLLQQNQPAEAITYFSQALQIDPTYTDAWYHRGVAYGGQANFDAAIADFSRVLALNGNYIPAYTNRGKARFFQGDFNGAVSDMTQIATLDPQPSSFYYRALAERAEGNTSAASDDFLRSANAGLAYSAFWLWIAGTEAGQKQQANQNLSDYFEKHPSPAGDWSGSIADFLLKRISQAEFLNRAKLANPALAEPCEAWFFIGISKRLAGEVPGAREAFQKAIATGSKSSVEYAEAQLELASLSKG